jgi:O-antigen/teichoic acid export membrane protein
VTEPQGTRATERRVAWGLLDQVVSSGSNFLATIIAAKLLSAENFGAFALAMAVALVVVFLARGLAGDPLATAHAADSPEELRAAARMAVATTLFVTSACAVVTAVVGLAVGGVAGPVLLALAVLLPGLAIQDLLRFVLIIGGQAKRTFLNDLFWLVVQGPLMVLAGATGSGAFVLLAWGVAGNLAAVLGFWQTRTPLGGPGAIRPWLVRHRNLWPFFVLDNLVYQAINLVLIIVISLASTLAQVGGFRAAMTVYAPLAIIGRGVVGVAVPELARRREDPLAVRRLGLLIAWALTPLAVIAAVLTQLIPDSVGASILGASWSMADPLLLLAGAVTAVSLFTVGTVAGIRALGAGREGLTARILVSLVAIAFGSVGAVVGGAHGALTALAMSSPLQIGTWWWLLVKASRPKS